MGSAPKIASSLAGLFFIQNTKLNSFIFQLDGALFCHVHIV